MSLLAQLIDHSFCGYPQGPHGDNQGVSVIGAIVDQRIGRASAENLFEGVLDFGIHLPSVQHCFMVLGAMCNGLVRSFDLAEGVGGFVQPVWNIGRRQEAINLALSRNLHLGSSVRKDKTLHAAEGWHHHPRVFGQLEGAEHRIENLLVIGRVELQPSQVPQHQRVAMIRPNIPRRTHRSVGDRHDNR